MKHYNTLGTRFLIILFVLSVMGIPGTLCAQMIDDLAFQNQQITDILRALGNAADITVITDKTVEGRASFHSQGLEIRQAIELFLKSEQLYGQWDNKVLYVSRVRIQVDAENKISLDAEDASIEDIVLALSRKVASSVVFDALPRERISVHVENQKTGNILEILLKKYPDYQLEEDDGYFYIRYQRNTGTSGGMGASLGRDGVIRQGNEYALNIRRQVRFLDVLERLFQLSELEFSYLGRNNGMLSPMQFSLRSFDELFRLILDQGSCDFTLVGNVYYIFDIQRNEVLQRHNATVLRRLSHLDAKSITRLFPQNILRSITMNVDEARNALILFGTLEALGTVQEFIDLVDVPTPEEMWQRYDLDYLNPSSLSGLLPGELKNLSINAIPETMSVLISGSPEQHKRLKEWLEIADKPLEGYPVTLSYISSEELIANLPPSFSDKDVRKTQNPNMVFFLGSRTKLSHFKEALRAIDKPIPQIRYDLLVIQYQENQSIEWDHNLSMKRAEFTPGSLVQGALSPLLDLSFDIVSTFGYQFALELSLKLTESKAKVIADSSLNGLSGESLSFRNTNTYRYRETKVDTNGNVVLSSEKEITSGLFIDINGNVSGDNMVSMDIQTTISKQLATSSTSENNLPPTSEKRIDTHIRSAAGRPVIIGGLTQQELTSSTKKVPGLGEVPVLKWLFRTNQKTMENTEFVVYIVPHIEFDRNFQSDEGGLFRDVYERYIER